VKKIAVTGFTGFVGKRLLEIDQAVYQLVPIDLRKSIPDLLGIDTIVHLAGKAHQMTPIEDRIYFEVNYELTKKLADLAKQAGVKHFVYISSVKVYNDSAEDRFDESSPCVPTDAYGASKLKAEQYLQSMQADSFSVSIIRPPLVYGPGVKGNMNKLIELAARNYPLPFGNINNARSMVFVDNLIAMINKIIDKQAAGVFIAGDQSPVSTTELLLRLRTALGKKAGLISIPLFIRQLLKRIKPGLYSRLFGSFVIDNASTNKKLDFSPPYTTSFGIQQMVNGRSASTTNSHK
jgi:nucleoside-diphosphate-sugar epimerase